MARGPFGTPDFGNNTSGAPIGGDIGAPAAGAAGALASTVHGFARELRGMADKQLTREGQEDAMKVVQASRDFGQTPQLREEKGVDDAAFNTIVRQNLRTDYSREFRTLVSQAEADHPTDPLAFSEAVQAATAPFRQKFQNDPELALAFDNDAVVVTHASLSRVQAGQQAQRRDISRAAYINVQSESETQLGQVLAGAGFDDRGAQLVSVALNEHLKKLAAFGPREAFEIGGVQFEADPTRAGTISATDLAQAFDQTQVRARTSWLVEAVNRSPDAASAQALIGQVREQWEGGNPAFAGLGASEMGQITARMDAVANRMAGTEDAQRRAAAAELSDLMTAAEYGGGYDADRMRSLAAASGDAGLQAKVEFGLNHGFDVTPASLRSDSNATGAAGFSGWVGHLLDDLEGPGLVADDNGAGSAQWGITRRSHPEAWADGRVDRQEAERIYRGYWNDIGGDNLPPALAAAAASFAVVAGAGKAREALAQAGGDLNRFYAAELAHYEKLARDNPAQYADDLAGWRNRIEKSRRFAMGIVAEERAAQGFASDPIGFARGKGRREALADVPEFDINRLFGEDPAGAGAFLRDRLALGQQLNQRSGVPLAVFDSAELQTLKDRIDADPAAIVQLVTVAATAPGVGPQGTRTILRQLGVSGTATSDLHLGWLATTAETRNIATKIIQGRSMRAGGARDVQWPSDQISIAAATQQSATAFALQPELNATVQALAADMAVADQARGQLKPAASYVNSALGATNSGGHRYGGLVGLNGASTIVPTWLRADMMDEALETTARLWEAGNSGPRYSNGQPIPARVLSRYTLRLAPNGRYRMVTPQGQEVAGPNGRAFEFNIDAMRDEMGRRYPGSVLNTRP